MSRLLQSRFALAVASAVLLSTACSDSPSEPRIPAEIEVVTGEDQIGAVGAQLPDPIVVVVLDANGRPVRDQAVTFTVTGGGTVQNASTRTDAAGLAQARWTLGTVLETEQRLEVRAVSGSGSTLASTLVYATAGPAPAARLMMVSPNPQGHWEGGTLGIPPSVRVVDQFGNPVPGVPVTFTVTAGGGRLTNPTVTSGAMGIATVGGWTLGAVGTNTVVATSGNLEPVTFTATARSLTPARVILSAGQNQFAGVTTNVPIAPSVIVQNAAGDALPGIPVTFTPGPNSGNVTNTTVTTNTSGVATVGGWSLGTVAGPQTLVAAASPTATFTFNAEATPGAPRLLEKTAGDAQVGAPGSTLPILPAVTVKDAYGNVVPQVPVTFAVYNGGGSIAGATAISSAKGVATAGSWTLGPLSGTQTLRASAAGTNDADFTARAGTGAASLITRHPQNPTTAVPGREITLSVIVLNDVGEPKAGVPVDFASFPTMHPGAGMVLAPYQGVLTNAQGVASVRYVMPTNVYAPAGVYASSSGLQQLQINVSPLIGPAAEILVTLPNTTVIAGGDLGQPVFTVRDIYGTPIPMFPVKFTVTGGGGTVNGAVETQAATASPPMVTATGPMWKSGPVAGQNTLVVSTPTAPNVPSVVLVRNTVSPP